ncbi:MAG: permease [Planctomycetota bacterium]
MFWLIVSLLLLAAAPVCHRLARPARSVFAGLDGFTYVIIGGTVLFEVLPEALQLAGPWMVLAALLGFAGPTLVERARGGLGRQAHAVALVLALVGLMLHGFVDGMALAPSGAESDAVLPLAVVLHRLPDGLTIWWLLRPQHSVRIAAGVLFSMGLFTVGGFYFGGSVLTGLDGVWIGLFQALVGGALLHVLVHSAYPLARHDEASPESPRGRFAAGIGATVALACVVALVRTPHEHLTVGGSPHHHTDEFAHVFFELALASAPALLLGYLAAGLMHAFLPKASVAWLGRGSHLAQAVRGVAFGLPIPICSCGVVPIYRSLVLRGAPVAAATALLVAAPELGIDAVLISLPLLGGSFTIARVAAAAIVALAIGWYLGRWSQRNPTPPAEPTEHEVEPAAPQTLTERLRHGLQIGLGEMVDHTGPWVLLGLIVAAGAQPILEGDWFGAIPHWLEVPIFALLGMPVYVCASGATPLVAILIANGVSPGAGLAFLLTGPATNVTTFGILKQLHGAAFAWRFALGMAALAITAGFVVQLVLVGGGVAPHEEHLHGSWWRWSWLALLGAVFLSSILRQGPRAFVGEIFTFPGDDRRDSPPQPGCSHNHG